MDNTNQTSNPILSCLDDIDNFYDSDEEIETTEQTSEDVVIGIDLGTTNSCVSIWRNDNLEIIPDQYGKRTMPSIVSFTNRNTYVGREAKNQTDINPLNTIYEVKRLIGRKKEDEEVQKFLPYFSYEITEDHNGNALVQPHLETRPDPVTPEEVSSIILKRLKNMAEDYLDCPVNKAVVTVPAYFNEPQRQATRDASRIAGLECVRIINEPTAAASACGLERKSKELDREMYVIVYDFGGGTLDVSLICIDSGVFQVLASTGNSYLGGADFDNAIMDWAIRRFKAKHKIQEQQDLDISPFSTQKLKKSCEQAKITLSQKTSTTIFVSDFYDDKDLILKINRKQLSTICKELLLLCMYPIERVIQIYNEDNDEDLEPEEIDEVILVGGSTRMPAVREQIKLFFKGKEPNCSVNADEVVAMGAAVEAYKIQHKRNPFSEDILLLDVTPLSLGVETIGGVMEVLIPRNKIIPTETTKRFTTDSDDETSVIIKIFEGERTLTQDNFFIGEFELGGLEPAPRGVADIAITIKVDVNGIISVSAIDRKNEENTDSITITSNRGRLTKEEIDELVLEARNVEMRDRLDRERKQLYYEVDDICSNIKHNVTSDDCSLHEMEKEKILKVVDEVLDWLKQHKYDETDKKEYQVVIEQLKKKYGVLMLKIVDKGEFKDDDRKKEGVNLYDDDVDENEKEYDRLLDEELGFTEDQDNNEREELKRLRDMFIGLCHTLSDISQSPRLKIDEKDRLELEEYVGEMMVWVSVREKLTKRDYEEQIEALNNKCQALVDQYGDDCIEQEEVMTARQQLEQLLYALLTAISTNTISLNKKQSDVLKGVVEQGLNWLVEVDFKEREEEIKGTNKVIDDSVYLEKMEAINTLSSQLYAECLESGGLEIKLDQVEIDEVDLAATTGTSIADLLDGGSTDTEP